MNDSKLDDMNSTLQELLDGDVCDVPIEASLKDGSSIVFWCDGARGGKSPELTGSFNGALTHLPESEIRGIRVLSKEEYLQKTNSKGVWWTRP